MIGVKTVSIASKWNMREIKTFLTILFLSIAFNCSMSGGKAVSKISNYSMIEMKAGLTAPTHSMGKRKTISMDSNYSMSAGDVKRLARHKRCVPFARV